MGCDREQCSRVTQRAIGAIRTGCDRICRNAGRGVLELNEPTGSQKHHTGPTKARIKQQAHLAVGKKNKKRQQITGRYCKDYDGIDAPDHPGSTDPGAQRPEAGESTILLFDDDGPLGWEKGRQTKD